MKLFTPLILVFICGNLSFINAQSCSEMLRQAQASEKQGDYFDAYKKYDAALRRCGETERDGIERSKNQLVSLLNDQKKRAVTAEKEAKKQADIAQRERAWASYIGNSSQNIALTLSLLKKDPTLALRVSELNYQSYPGDPASASNFFQILADTSNLFYVHRLDQRAKVLCGSIASDGYTAVAGMSNGQIVVWDTRTGGKDLKIHKVSAAPVPPIVNCIVFAPQGNKFFIGCSNGEKLIWNTTDLTGLPQKIGNKGGPVLAASYSEDGKHLAVAVDAVDALLPRVQIWATDTFTESPTYTIEYSNRPNTIAFKPGTASLAIGGDDNIIRIWEFQHKDSISTIYEGAKGDVTSLCFSPDGKLLLAGGSNGPISMWTVDQNKNPEIYSGHLDIVREVRFMPSGKYFSSVGLDKTMRIWKVGNTVSPVRTYRGHNSAINAVMMSSDKQLWTCSSDQTIRCWSYNNPVIEPEVKKSFHRGRIIGITNQPEHKHIWSVSSDGKLCCSTVDSALHFIRIDSLQIHELSVTAMTSVPGADLVFTGSLDSTIQFWTRADTSIVLLRKISKLPSSVLCLSVTPDGRWLAAGLKDSTIQIWNIKEPVPKLVVRTEKLNGQTLDLEFGPEGKLFSAGYYRDIYCWDFQDKKSLNLLKLLKGHAGRVSSISYNPDNHKLLSTSIDATIAVWDVDTYSRVESFAVNTSDNDEIPQLITWQPFDKGVVTSLGLPFLHHYHLEQTLIPIVSNFGPIESSLDITALEGSHKERVLIGRKDGTIEAFPTASYSMNKYAYRFTLPELIESGTILEFDSLVNQYKENNIFPAVAKLYYNKRMYKESKTFWEKAIATTPDPKYRVGLYQADKKLGMDDIEKLLASDSFVVREFISYFREVGDWANADRFITHYRRSFSDNYKLQAQHYAISIRAQKEFDKKCWEHLGSATNVKKVIQDVAYEVVPRRCDLFQKIQLYNDLLWLSDLGVKMDSTKFDKWNLSMLCYNLTLYSFRVGDYASSLRYINRGLGYYDTRQLIAFKPRVLLLLGKYTEAEEEYLKRLDAPYNPSSETKTYRDYNKWDLKDLLNWGVLNKQQRAFAQSMLLKM